MGIRSALAGAGVTAAVVIGSAVALSAANGSEPRSESIETDGGPGWVLVPKEVATMPAVEPRAVRTSEPTQEPTVTETTTPVETETSQPTSEPPPAMVGDPRDKPPSNIGTPPPMPPQPVMPSEP